MPIKIDLKAKSFGPEDHAWRLFPGTSYRHFDAMLRHQVVFLDFPGMPRPAQSGYIKDEETKSELIRATERARLIWRNVDDKEERLAAINEGDFDESRWSHNRNLALTWLNGLYNQAKRGDLIVVPTPGWRRSEDGEEWIYEKSLVGEIISDVRRWEQNGPREYLEAKYLVRQVRWLARLDESDLTPTARKAFRTQNALVQIPTTELYRVLGAAYKNVYANGDFIARFLTENADFTAHENYHFQAFVMAAVAAYRVVKGEAPADELVGSIYDIAAEVPRDHQYVPEQDASIHSPGYTTLRARNTISMVVACLFALALSSDALPLQAPDLLQVEVINSESSSFDPCLPDIGIDQDVRNSLEVLGFDRWQEMCRAATKAHENEGFKPISVVKDD